MSRSTSKLYFAYGSNLYKMGMMGRCRDSRPLLPAYLADHMLTFRNVATVQPAAGFTVPGALYYVSSADERALDSYEGFPAWYHKEEGTITHDGRQQVVFWYQLDKGRLSGPGQHYLNIVREGYRDWRLPQRALTVAVAHSHNVEVEVVDDHVVVDHRRAPVKIWKPKDDLVITHRRLTKKVKQQKKLDDAEKAGRVFYVEGISHCTVVEAENTMTAIKKVMDELGRQHGPFRARVATAEDIAWVKSMQGGE